MATLLSSTWADRDNRPLSIVVELRIEVYGFAGFHVLTNRTRVASSGDRYTIATDLDTRGIASIFVDLNSHSEVRGRLTHDAARPEAYHGDLLRNGADRHYRSITVPTAR